MARHSRELASSLGPQRCCGRWEGCARWLLAGVLVTAAQQHAFALQAHVAAPAARPQGTPHVGGGGYLQPRTSQGGPGGRPQPAPPAQSPRYQAPPANNRPLITARPLAPAPDSEQRSLGPRVPYAPPQSNANRGTQQHLGGWLQSHQGQPFASQEQSLRQEPGFSRLPQPQQQRLIDRLHQLDTMPPQRRERTLGRIENLERLSPDRRQQVRNSAQELSAMPEERKQQVRGAFRTLRDLPPQERQQQLASPAFRSQYSEHERQILGNLLSVEPYQPR